jgi:hypothetical protein
MQGGKVETPRTKAERAPKRDHTPQLRFCLGVAKKNGESALGCSSFVLD